jgi:hypothetical protein
MAAGKRRGREGEGYRTSHLFTLHAFALPLRAATLSSAHSFANATEETWKIMITAQWHVLSPPAS